MIEAKATYGASITIPEEITRLWKEKYLSKWSTQNLRPRPVERFNSLSDGEKKLVLISDMSPKDISN